MADAVAGLDAGFLLTETSTMPWHVLGVLVLDPSTAPEPFTVDSVRRLVAARLNDIEAFHKVIVGDPLGVWPRWADADVDLDQHLHVADLPPDAGITDLEELAARIAEEPLDRSRPLWEFHVVEQLADGRAAIIAKVHHALADGVTAVGILSGLLDLEPLPPGPPSIDLTPAGPPPAVGLTDLPRLMWRAGWSASRAAVRAAQRGLTVGRHSFGFMAARTSGHARLTSRRQVALGTIAVDGVMRAKAAYGVTFNDIVLAAITGRHATGSTPTVSCHRRASWPPSRCRSAPTTVTRSRRATRCRPSSCRSRSMWPTPPNASASSASTRPARKRCTTTSASAPWATSPPSPPGERSAACGGQHGGRARHGWRHRWRTSSSARFPDRACRCICAARASRACIPSVRSSRAFPSTSLRSVAATTWSSASSRVPTCSPMSPNWRPDSQALWPSCSPPPPPATTTDDVDDRG